ncbi:MAG TPA: M48 family metalloprotease [Terracidiphilus sp.]|jgi:predicted Zn-dependent protease|nr:M48 family metalloprotease [Terracidiphilus sp.]
MAIVSRREWLWKASAGTMAAMALGHGSPSWSEEPHVTVSPLNTLTDEQEIELGRRFAAELDTEQQIIENPLIDAYLNKMIMQLASKGQRPNLPYSVKLVNSHVPNAESLPGGFLYVNRGLVELIGTEDELAATLAHEVGHVVGRHVVNKLVLTFRARAMLQPVLDDLDKQNGVIRKIILQFGGAVAMLAMLHFSRRDEAEADLLGFYEMLRAGWDPHGFLKLFSQFDVLEKSSGGAPIPFLSDHPPTPQRAAAITRELKQVTIPAKATANTVKFQVFKSAMGLLPEPVKTAQAAPAQDEQ